MIIQFFLTMMLGAIAVFMALQRATSGGLKTTIVAVVCAGIVFVWVPDQANVLAAVLGVGRGADLVLYLWVVITFAVMLVLYLEIVRMGRRVTQLTRALALFQAEQSRADEEIQQR